jgi:peroxiredoxin
MEIKLKGVLVITCVSSPLSFIMNTNWKIEENEMETKFKLVVKNSGSYTADSFLELIWIVFKHRCGHFFKGEGFVD